jgi:hypothetical protein
MDHTAPRTVQATLFKGTLQVVLNSGTSCRYPDCCSAASREHLTRTSQFLVLSCYSRRLLFNAAAGSSMHIQARAAADRGVDVSDMAEARFCGTT